MASLTPSNTEILAFLGRGDALVARDSFSDWPPAVEEVPEVGPDLQIDVERLAELDLDLVLAAESVPGQEQVTGAVERAGLHQLVLAPTSLTEVREDVRRVARALAVPERGRRLAEAMREGVSAVEAALEGVEARTVYWEWWPDPPIAPGAGGWMDEVLRRAGGRNAFGDREAQSLEVTREEVTRARPEAIALCWQGALHPVQSVERLRERDKGAWTELDAVRRGRVLLRPEALYGRPGPRLVEGIRQLAGLLHPDRSGELPEPYAWLPDDLKDPLPLSEV